MKINDSMGVGDRAPLSRRQWLKRIPLSAFAFLGGAKLVGQKRPDIEAKGTTASESHRGVGVYNVRDYGAKGDGIALDTAAVQAAIDACSRDGGGTVVVPAGVFQVGTLELKSNVTFHIAAAGKILGSADGKQYHAVNAIPLQRGRNFRRRKLGPDLCRRWQKHNGRRARHDRWPGSAILFTR